MLAANERRFRFGVTNGAVADLQSWTQTARRAESMGYSTFLLPDTLFTQAPLPTLAAAAAVTSDLRVGTWVLCDPLRNPRLVAWEAASLATLSAGRFELGLGAGRPGAEADAERLHVRYGSPAERVQRLEATIQTIRALLSGHDPDFPSARSEHAVPILIAASGPRLLAVAAREADIVAFGWPPDTTEDAALRRVEQVRAAAGARFDEVELAAGLIAVGDRDHPWLRRMGFEAQALAAAGAVTVLTGTPAEMAEALRRRRDRLGLSYFTVPAESAETFAPVVASLAGQ
jgi:probable F420-dependent oxidoreductase